jgi:drug/metabolite transporter (DMT)-like permease
MASSKKKPFGLRTKWFKIPIAIHPRSSPPSAVAMLRRTGERGILAFSRKKALFPANEQPNAMFLRKKGIGPAWIIASAFSYGATDIFLKLSAPHLTVWQTAMGRFMLGLIFVPVIARIAHFKLFGHSRWILMARALSGTIAFLLVIEALKMIPLSIALVLFYLWPVFSCLMSSWIADEPTTKREWPFVGGALLGVALILWPEKVGQSLNLGYFLALLSSFFAGLAIILVRRLRRINNPFTIYYYFCLVGCLSCTGPFFAQGSPLLPRSSDGWFCLVAVAITAMGGQVLMNQGMKYMNASRTSSFMMFEVLVASAFGVIYLGEPLSFRLLIGSIMILGCGATLMLLPLRTKPIESEREGV